MNTSECDPGWATDEIFALSENTCASPLAAYGVLASCLLLLKLVIVMKMWKGWVVRNRAHAKSKRIMTPTRFIQRRLPLSPIGATLQGATWLALFVSIGIDAASARNGVSCALLGVGLGLFGVNSGLLLRKYVSLGSRLVPLAGMRGPVTSTGTGEDSGSGSGVQKGATTEPSTVNTESSLGLLDTRMRLSVFIQVLALLATFATSLVPAVSGSHNASYVGVTWVRVCLGMFALYALFLLESVAHHLDRLIFTIQEITNQRDVKTTTQGVNRAIQKMRISKIVLASGGLVGVVFYSLCAAGVIPLLWETLIVIVFLDVILSAFPAWIHAVRGPKKALSTSKKQEHFLLQMNGSSFKVGSVAFIQQANV